MKTNSPTLQEQLKSEERVCPECSYHVTNPLYERCPRCFSMLPKLELYCQGCLHRSQCPAAASAEGMGAQSKRSTGINAVRDSQTRS